MFRKASIHVGRTGRAMRCLFAAAIVAATVTGGASFSEAAEKIVMRNSLPSPAAEYQSQALEIMKDYIDRSLPGQIDVQNYPGSTLFKQPQIIPELQRGNLEGVLIDTFFVAKKVPTASVLNTGYLVRDLPHACGIWRSKFGRKLRTEIEEKMKVKILALNYLGTRTLAIRKAADIKTPKDLAGIKQREPGAKAWQFTAKALGSNPVSIPYGELFLALQTGTADAYSAPPSAIVGMRLNEVSEQVVLTNHLTSYNMFAVSTAFWDALNEEQQEVVSEAAQAGYAFSTRNRLRAESKALKQLRELGMKITTPDVDAFREHVFAAYRNADFAKGWPKGVLEDLAAIPASDNCAF